MNLLACLQRSGLAASSDAAIVFIIPFSHLSVSLSDDCSTLRSGQSGPDFLALLIPPGTVVSNLLGQLVVACWDRLWLPPVHLLDVGLLLFVGAHHSVVAVVRLLVVVLLFLLWLVDSGSEPSF